MRFPFSHPFFVSATTFLVLGLSFVCFFAIRDQANVPTTRVMELTFPNPNHEDNPFNIALTECFFYKVHSIAEITVGGSEEHKRLMLEECKHQIRILETIKDQNAIIKIKYGANFKYEDFIRLADLCFTLKTPAFADFDSCMIVRYVVAPWPDEGYSRATSPVL